MAEPRPPSPEYVVVRHRPGRAFRRVIALILLVLAAAGAGYFAGLAQGGFRFSDVKDTNADLQTELSSLQQAQQRARQQLANLERGKIMDQQALKAARDTIAGLEDQMAALRNDLTFYRNIMAPSEVNKGLQVDSLTLSRGVGPASWDYRLVLTQLGQNQNYIAGAVAVNVIGTRNGDRVVVPLSELSGDLGQDGIRFRFRFFQNIEGTLTVPKDFRPARVQVVAQASGRKSAQAERTFEWQQLTEK
ncbi:DUF6776 family protein [Marinobacter sp. C2H3]|uniref:DUF6776 family protein n=1 Tax=Marinobacter sp. C2H3 TaxID=3119003 RepID=UPI00300ED71B